MLLFWVHILLLKLSILTHRFHCSGKGSSHYYVDIESCWLLVGTRFSEGDGSSNEVQRTMLELINQLDGFDPRGNIKVLMATNRPDTLDPALMRPGRMDRKVEFGLPDLEVGTI